MTSQITTMIRKSFDQLFGLRTEEVSAKSNEENEFTSKGMTEDENQYEYHNKSTKRNNHTEKRCALIVGINEYQQENKFPKLSGAENDATEISQQLKESNENNFSVYKSLKKIASGASVPLVI